MNTLRSSFFDTDDAHFALAVELFNTLLEERRLCLNFQHESSSPGNVDIVTGTIPEAFSDE